MALRSGFEDFGCGVWRAPPRQIAAQSHPDTPDALLLGRRGI